MNPNANSWNNNSSQQYYSNQNNMNQNQNQNQNYQQNYQQNYGYYQQQMNQQQMNQPNQPQFYQQNPYQQQMNQQNVQQNYNQNYNQQNYQQQLYQQQLYQQQQHQQQQQYYQQSNQFQHQNQNQNQRQHQQQQQRQQTYNNANNNTNKNSWNDNSDDEVPIQQPKSTKQVNPKPTTQTLNDNSGDESKPQKRKKKRKRTKKTKNTNNNNNNNQNNNNQNNNSNNNSNLNTNNNSNNNSPKKTNKSNNPSNETTPSNTIKKAKNPKHPSQISEPESKTDNNNNSNNNNNNNKSKAKTSEAKDNLLNITNANKKKNTNQKNKASDDVKKVKKKKVKAHDKREHLNLVLIGHVDAGKSTISGQILLQTGQIDQRTIDKYKREAKDKNRESWWIAYIMDEDNEERAKGKTVECGRAHFDTSNKRYTILDAPGHKNYVPNMIQGATQADVALLVISARQNEFEAGFNRGGQTREHALLAYTLGITRIVVIVNKIDSCNYSQERYQEIVTAIKKFLNDIGFKSKYVEFLPLSGQNGINIINNDNNELSWYNGKTLIKCLDELPKMKRKNNNPLRIPVLDKYKGDKGIMIIGKLEAGTLSINDYVKVEPAGRDFKILTIEIDDVSVENAKSGENVLLGIGNTQINMDQIFSGSVISSIQNPVPVSTKFIAQIYVNELPNKSIMTKGYQAMFHCHNISCNCEIIDIPHKINKKNGKKSKIPPPFLRTHESAIASIKLSNKYPIESFDNCNQLGRFTLRDSGRTCVIGKISQVL